MTDLTSPAIEVSQLQFRIGRRTLLHSLSFSVARGRALAVIGHNGAGKTTLFQAMLGIKIPSRGEVRFFGRSHAMSRAREGLGYVPERPYLNLDLGFRSFLSFHAELIGLRGEEKRREIVRSAEEAGLGQHLGQGLKSFSKGMLQKAVLAQASLGNPGILILDEPLSGLDPESRDAVKDRMRAWKHQGRTMVFSSHVFEDVETLAEEVLVLKGGVLHFFGSVEEWRRKG